MTAHRRVRTAGMLIDDDAQPGAQPDAPVCGFNMASIGAARRLA